MALATTGILTALSNPAVQAMLAGGVGIAAKQTGMLDKAKLPAMDAPLAPRQTGFNELPLEIQDLIINEQVSSILKDFGQMNRVEFGGVGLEGPQQSQPIPQTTQLPQQDPFQGLNLEQLLPQAQEPLTTQLPQQQVEPQTEFLPQDVAPFTDPVQRQAEKPIVSQGEITPEIQVETIINDAISGKEFETPPFKDIVFRGTSKQELSDAKSKNQFLGKFWTSNPKEALTAAGKDGIILTAKRSGSISLGTKAGATREEQKALFDKNEVHYQDIGFKDVSEVISTIDLAQPSQGEIEGLGASLTKELGVAVKGQQGISKNQIVLRVGGPKAGRATIEVDDNSINIVQIDRVDKTEKLIKRGKMTQLISSLQEKAIKEGKEFRALDVGASIKFWKDKLGFQIIDSILGKTPSGTQLKDAIPRK